MKRIQNTGLVFLLVGLTAFTSLTFLGSYELTEERLTSWAVSKGIKSDFFLKKTKQNLVGVKYSTPFEMAGAVISLAQQSHDFHVKQIRLWESEGKEQQQINEEWSKVLWLSWYKNHKDFTYNLLKASLDSPVVEYQLLFFLLTFGLAITGTLMFIVPDIILLGAPGIKNDGVFHNSSTNAGWVSKIAFTYLVVFYVVLYFYPDYIINQVLVVNPISEALSGQHASQWFLYGFMYCVIMSVMAIRMYVKYRHNRYQLLRTTSVLFFQIAFAFLIPELLVRFNMPWYDFKNAWPLDYDFFYAWSLDELQSKGAIGMFILVWGILLTVVLVPLFVYLYGKRWYCSWVCGCGGLAETLGDPYRQLSDKRLKAWKVERWLINGVFVFAFFMTAATLYSYFTAVESILGIAVYDLQSWYGFLIGSIFAGVVGTGFYPVMGNRVWCRFGCPLAAYMGLVQRFKSRFRITTNGGQCISCGNCSTYCEQGIDVRWYAQRQQNIVRSSCVGCGICSAVCPRGVLKLENGPEEGRFDITNLPSVGNQK